jgi:hypothetical protein
MKFGRVVIVQTLLICFASTSAAAQQRDASIGI